MCIMQKSLFNPFLQHDGAKHIVQTQPTKNPKK